MTTLHCRQATRDDLPDILAMLADDDLGRQRERTGEDIDPRYLAAFDAIAANPDQLQAVAECDGRVVGCMQLSFLPGLSHQGMWRGQIESVRIASDLRGQGLGRQFFAWALEQFRERGCGLVQLTTHKSRDDAARFYESLRFQATHEGYKLPL